MTQAISEWKQLRGVSAEIFCVNMAWLRTETGYANLNECCVPGNFAWERWSCQLIKKKEGKKFAVCFRQFPQISYNKQESIHFGKQWIVTPNFLIKAFFKTLTSQGPPVLNYYIINFAHSKSIPHLASPTSNHLSSDLMSLKLYHPDFLLLRHCQGW